MKHSDRDKTCRLVFALLLFILLSVPQISLAKVSENLTVVRTIAPQSENDTAHQYFINIIQLALDKASSKYGEAQLVMSPYSMTQARWFRLLENSQYLDIIWSGANKQRQDRFQEIPIDLLGGILGVRVLIIRKENKLQFKKIKNIEDLKQFTACQAEHWPDATILQDAGMPLLTVNKFETNFIMLEKGQCDYFPRGIHEGYSEIEKYHVLQGGSLILFDDFFIVYPFNMWLFVDKGNKALAERIEYGLKRAIKDGSFLTLIKQDPITSHLFPLERWADRKVFQLENHVQYLRTNPESWWLLKQFPFLDTVEFDDAK